MDLRETAAEKDPLDIEIGSALGGDSPLHRVLDILNYLAMHPEGSTRNDLAREFKVSRHTIYRDLVKVEQIAPISMTLDGKLYIDRKDYLVNVHFSLHEAMAIHLATRLLVTRMDRRNRHAASALDKLSKAIENLAPPISQQMALSAQSLRSEDQWEDRSYLQALETLTQALAEGRKVKIWHRRETTGEISEYIIAPYFIEPYAIGQTTYLIGLNEARGELWKLKIERIEKVELLRECYILPPDFDPQAQLGDAWGIWFTGREPVEVVLEFSATVARRVQESRWHRSQQIEVRGDGSLIWRAWIAEPKEMMPWVRSWGAEVKVIEPAQLRVEISKDAEKMGRLYE